MPLQNRVTPEGEIVATPERGLLMGNRGGQIHRDDKTLSRRRWSNRAWITCLLAYKNRRELIMAPRHYTQLFFLDEATALAAGHRPCALCRRSDYNWFAQAFAAGAGLTEPLGAAQMDRQLHSERLAEARRKRTHHMPFGALPDGAILKHDGAILLKAGDRLLRWSPAGYRANRLRISPSVTVEVLTPPAILGVLHNGYQPLLHPTAAEAR